MYLTAVYTFLQVLSCSQMSRPVTGKDMDSFARQLDNIGNQLRDLATASRMETLSSRTRRLIDSHIRPLEVKKVSANKLSRYSNHER